MKKNMMLKSSLRIMASHKLRSFFMMIGMVIGVAALILVFSLGKGTEKKIMMSIERMFNSSSILISAGRGKMMSGTQDGGPVTSLTVADIEFLQQAVPNIIMADPMQTIPGREIRFAGKSVSATVWGNSEYSRQVWNRGISRGEYFDREAVRSLARVALVGKTVVRELFGNRDPLGEQILVGNVPFRVLGIMEPMGTDIHGNDRDNEISVPISTLMRRLLNVIILSPPSWSSTTTISWPGRRNRYDGFCASGITWRRPNPTISASSLRSRSRRWWPRLPGFSLCFCP